MCLILMTLSAFLFVSQKLSHPCGRPGMILIIHLCIANLFIASWVGVERCRKLILLSISRNLGKKLTYYQQELLQFQQPKIELQSRTLSFLQSCFCIFCRYNFGNFFSDAESANISALGADDFTDVTLVEVTWLI